MTAPETISAVDPADWVTIWQSEMAALAVDPECTEAMLLWGQAWVAAGDGARGRDDEPSRGRDAEPSRGRDAEPPAGRAGADAAAGPAPAPLAPDVERELERLRGRIAELERGG